MNTNYNNYDYGPPQGQLLQQLHQGLMPFSQDRHADAWSCRPYIPGSALPDDSTSLAAYMPGGYAQQPAARQNEGANNGAQNNWVCLQCNNDNFAFRTVCNRCGTAKGASGTSRNTVTGGWICPDCKNLNFPFRTDCNRCKAAKPVEVSTVDTKQDWTCPTCANVNFAFRMECNRCQQPRPLETPKVEEQKEWLCALCSNVNFPFRTECNRCKTPKGDTECKSWECKTCGNHNFKFREACNRCSARRPDPEGRSLSSKSKADPADQSSFSDAEIKAVMEENVMLKRRLAEAGISLEDSAAKRTKADLDSSQVDQDQSLPQ